MNRTCIKGFSVYFCDVPFSSLVHSGRRGATSPTYSITDQELDGVLAPIALYPDPLLAELLPASTYPAEIADAAAWLRSGQDPRGLTIKTGMRPSGQLPAIQTFLT